WFRWLAESAGGGGAEEAGGDRRWPPGPGEAGRRAYIRLAKMLMRQLDRDLHAFGLSTNDYEILVELSEAPGNRLRMNELADLTAQSRSRLSHHITRMEAKALVRREGWDGDKRGTFAVITPHGMTTIERVAPSHVDSVRRHFIDQICAGHLAA